MGTPKETIHVVFQCHVERFDLKSCHLLKNGELIFGHRHWEFRSAEALVISRKGGDRLCLFLVLDLGVLVRVCFVFGFRVCFFVATFLAFTGLFFLAACDQEEDEQSGPPGGPGV